MLSVEIPVTLEPSPTKEVAVTIPVTCIPESLIVTPVPIVISSPTDVAVTPVILEPSPTKDVAVTTPT